MAVVVHRLARSGFCPVGHGRELGRHRNLNGFGQVVEGASQPTKQGGVRMNLRGGLPLPQGARERQELAGVGSGEQLVEDLGDSFRSRVLGEPGKPGELLGENFRG
jgi:hypothetical protein